MANNENSYFVPAAIVIAGLIIAGSVVFSNNQTPAPADEKAPTPPAQQQPAAPKEAPTVDDDDVLGDEDAKVTIIEFSDYECPFCGRFVTGAMAELKEKYVETGKVKYVFRDFPLGFHQKAQKAAEAAECAGDQEKYWEMHDKLFENSKALEVDQLKQYAADLGLNTGTFNSCLDEGTHEAEVKKDFGDGVKAGVSGTPSFFINGQKLVGAQPFAKFEEIIEAELAK